MAAGKGKDNADWRRMYFLLAQGIGRALETLPETPETVRCGCVLQDAMKAAEEVYAETAFDTDTEVW